MVNSIDYHPCPSRLASRCILSYFYELLRTFSLSSMLVEFSLKLVYIPPCVENFFKFMVFTFLENALNLGIFTHVSPHSKLAPKFLLSHPRQKEITHSQGSIFPKICFPNSRRGGGNYDLLYQNTKIQSENMKMTWDIRLFIFCVICNFFKCDGFTIL